MKRIWLAAALIVALGQVSFAVSRVVEVTPDNIKEQPFRFTISSELDDKGGVWIRVAVAGKEEKLSPSREGKLSVLAGKTEIAMCSLREYEKNRIVQYSFRLDKHYLADSTFCYFDQVPEMPAFTGYRFRLGSFVKED